MRVIAGSARGIRLDAPPGRDIRPTLDRVREALFSILMSRIEGSRFLDLFAGTGANGIEALSRGAAAAIFVDASRPALNTVRDNLTRARVAQRAMSLQLELPREIARISGNYDIVFADPAYDFGLYTELLAGIEERALLADDGIIVIEHKRGTELPESVGTLERSRVANYGQCALSFYSVA